ncbi:MAG: hypothetical protein ABSG43_18770 [Solirubrobacteraceae bacterium]|jgi:hypothetical protein
MLWNDVLIDDYITDGARLMEVTTKRAQRNYGLLGGLIFRFVHALDSATLESWTLDERTLDAFSLVVPAR